METEKKPTRQRRRKASQEGLFPEASKPRKVLLTGATGFVGRALLQALLQRGFTVVALARRHPHQEPAPGLVRVAADVVNEGWESWAEGCEAAIHLVGIIRELPKENVTFHRIHVQGTARVLEACEKLGIARYLHMSAVGANPQGLTAYHRTKGQAEELVKASSLSWTIFRPSVIFGPGDGFTSTLARVIKGFPVVPVFGDGSYPLQPVAVEEVAQAFALSLDKPETVGQVIELGGPEVLTYLQVLQRVARALGKKRFFLKLPINVVRFGVKLATKFLPNPPITSDELTMLLAGSIADVRLARQYFGLPQKPFYGGVASPETG
ncbi:MAG: complex I NDUFA9 subunit family protein [Thermoanaerobaculaceae bacterium]